jgi:hypothetical protein
MSTIETFFLRAKHWQVFLVFCISSVAEAVALHFAPLTVSLPSALASASVIYVYLAWLWSMGSFLHSILPSPLRIKIPSFRFTLIYSAVYAVASLAFFDHLDSARAFAIIFLPHLLALFCMLHNLYFVSNSLVVAETGKPTTSFFDYAGPFLLLWFFPVGIWVIQPRINRLYADRKNMEPRVHDAPVGNRQPIGCR